MRAYRPPHSCRYAVWSKFPYKDFPEVSTERGQECGGASSLKKKCSVLSASVLVLRASGPVPLAPGLACCSHLPMAIGITDSVLMLEDQTKKRSRCGRSTAVYVLVDA